MNVVGCNDNSDIVEDISPGGDVILVVGPCNVQLRVQSQCLRDASKVFRDMLDPDRTEPPNLSGETIQRVSLAKDNADALRTICCVIHHRNHMVPQAVTPKDVLRLALEAKKYDLLVALKYASASWLKPSGDEVMVDMAYLMAAAFVFSDMDTFAAHTLALILNYKGSYLGLLEDDTVSRVIPWNTFCR